MLALQQKTGIIKVWMIHPLVTMRITIRLLFVKARPRAASMLCRLAKALLLINRYVFHCCLRAVGEIYKVLELVQ